MKENAPLQCSIFGISPKGWHIDRLRDRLSRIVGGEWGEDPATSDDGIDIVVVRVADIRGLDVTTTDLTIRNVKETKIQDRLIGKQSILIEKSGGGEKSPVGRSVLGRAIHEKAICSNFMAKTDCLGWDDTLFIAYLLDAMYSSGVNTAHIQQTTGIQNLRVADYLNSIVALPPLPEQVRIAAYLDASCAAIDAAVNAKKKQIESLEHLREEIIENAVTKGIHIPVDMQMIGDEWIGEIPANWSVVRLKRIISAVDYGISESTIQEGRFLVLKMGHIQGGEIKVAKNDYVDDVSGNLLLDNGDLLFNRTNSPDQVGKAAIFRGEKSDEITFASYLVRLKTNHRADSYYFNYVLNSRGFLSFARKLAIPSVQQSNLNATRYCRMLVPLPPIEEQRSIRKFLDAKISEVSVLFSNIESQIATLIDYRKSLIHECVTGQRRINEADVAKVERILEQAAAGLPQQ